MRWKILELGNFNRKYEMRSNVRECPACPRHLARVWVFLYGRYKGDVRRRLEKLVINLWIFG